jgi:transcriptional regulator with PAS, ATPase and Fis domain
MGCAPLDAWIGEEVVAKTLAVGRRKDMPPAVAQPIAATPHASGDSPRAPMAAARRRMAQREALQQALQQPLATHGGNREAQAKSLGISLRTSYRRWEDSA